MLMRTLADYQAKMSAHLRDRADASALFNAGAFSVAEGLDVYRGNVTAAAANALRLTFPTVERLLGSAYFDHLCAQRLAIEAPQSACLAAYCQTFPDFVGSTQHLHRLPYLADIARFDLALERVANANRAARSPRVRLDPTTALIFSPTLECLALCYPADEIRAAIEADEEALTQLDMTHGWRWRALWRGEDGVQLRVLSPAAGRFLAAVLSRCDLEGAFEAAGADEVEGVAAAIEREIMLAPFTQILSVAE